MNPSIVATTDPSTYVFGIKQLFFVWKSNPRDRDVFFSLSNINLVLRLALLYVFLHG